MRLLSEKLHDIVGWLWGIPMPLLLLSAHLWLTARLRIPQRCIPMGIRESLRKEDGSRGGFGVLMISLAATLGVGNILGMALAVQVGGAGAVFWCWLSGLLGVATAYAECSTSIRYGKNTPRGRIGGPMVLMEKRNHPKIARMTAVCIILAGLCMGAAIPGNAIGSLAQDRLPSWIIAAFLAGLTGLVLLGKGESVAAACNKLVPPVVALYTVGCCGILRVNRAVLGETLVTILREAFDFRAAGAGIGTGAAMAALRSGISRGVFSNEAGLGTLGLAAGTQKPRDPAKQGMAAATAAFWDTAVFCALTGVAFAAAQLAHPDWRGETDALGFCLKAFGELPMGTVILFASLILLGFACILGWNAVASQAAAYLGGSTRRFAWLWLLTAGLGVFLPERVLWDAGDLANAAAVLPNLSAIWLWRRQIPRICAIRRNNAMRDCEK